MDERSTQSLQVARVRFPVVSLSHNVSGHVVHTPVYTTRLVAWQPRRAADTSKNRRQSFFCCCTASMEQAADGAETAAIDGSFRRDLKTFLFASVYTGTRIRIDSVMRPRSSSIGGAIKVPQLQLQLQLLRVSVAEWYNIQSNPMSACSTVNA